MKIICFCWNTQSIRLCETTSNFIMRKNREENWFNKYKYQYDAEIVDFMPNFILIMQEFDCDIVVFSFQEDASPGSYFHSDLLPLKMQEINYELLAREKIMGIGKTSLESFYNGEIKTRGLRTSIYAKKTFNYLNYKTLFYNPNFSRNKAAIGINIKLKNKKILTIVNTHLPYDSKSVEKSVDLQDYTIRQDSIFNSNIFFNEVCRNVISGWTDKSQSCDNYVFLMGDLNYRMKPFVNWSARETGEYILSSDYQEIKKYDEFYIQMKNNFIYNFNEGKKNKGPSFHPTCKMKKERIQARTDASVRASAFASVIDNYNLGQNDQRVPSYCDRILYKGNNIKCIDYNSLDEGVVKKSDHMAIYGLFEI